MITTKIAYLGQPHYFYRAMQLTPAHTRWLPRILDIVFPCMENYPANMIDLMDMFPTEESCLEYLIQVRWYVHAPTARKRFWWCYTNGSPCDFFTETMVAWHPSRRYKSRVLAILSWWIHISLQSQNITLQRKAFLSPDWTSFANWPSACQKAYAQHLVGVGLNCIALL